MARFRIPDHPKAVATEDGKYGVEYVIDAVTRRVVSVPEDHYSIPLAERQDEGWRLATEDEIRQHCKETGDWLPPELGEGRRGPGRPPKEGDS